MKLYIIDGMELYLPILFAVLVGIGHAFEPDHLIAVSNIVSKRDNYWMAVKDGLFWGLGHTTTLVIVGSVLFIFRLTLLNFNYIEVGVGVVLIAMGISRLVSMDKYANVKNKQFQHGFAYSIGLLHGLAGSGTLVLLVMSEIKHPALGVVYLLVFGLGSMMGMLVAAWLFCIPFTQRMKLGSAIKFLLVKTSSAICILYGGWIIYHNM